MKGKQPYSVRGFDTFSKESWDSGHFATEEAAISKANKHGRTMTQYCVYYENKIIHTAGTF